MDSELVGRRSSGSKKVRHFKQPTSEQVSLIATYRCLCMKNAARSRARTCLIFITRLVMPLR